MGYSEVFNNTGDRGAQKRAVAEWIYSNLNGSLQRYSCISLTPIVPKLGKPYVMLTFAGVSEARYVEHILATKCKNKNLDKKSILKGGQLTIEN